MVENQSGIIGDNSVQVEPIVMRCYTCKYWQGDKTKVAERMAEHPQCMDLFKGWPEYGGCRIDYEWKELRIVGDAYAVLEVPANFGCPYWGA
jgi:hypothetical protein